MRPVNRVVALLQNAGVSIPAIGIVDVGANPIDGAPPYKPLLEQELATVIGFEPDLAALAKLPSTERASFLPCAIGGPAANYGPEERRLHLCHASGMNSLFKLNVGLMQHFPGFEAWGAIKETVPVELRALDDLNLGGGIDYLKIDIQGGELAVFQGARHALRSAVFVQTEAMFVEMYEGQPLFAALDEELRSQGFQLHTILQPVVRGIGELGLRLSGAPYAGIRQVLQADVVYVRKLEHFNDGDSNGSQKLSDSALLKTAIIADACYQSFDLAHFALSAYDNRHDQSSLSSEYMREIASAHPKLLAGVEFDK